MLLPQQTKRCQEIQNADPKPYGLTNLYPIETSFWNLPEVSRFLTIEAGSVCCCVRVVGGMGSG